MASLPAVTSRTPRALRLRFSATTIVFGTAILLTGVIGWIGLAEIERRSRGELEARLNAEVDTSVLALQLWLDDQRNVAESWASAEDLRTEITEYLTAPAVRNWDRDRVLASDELQRLRTRLAPVCRIHDYVGFVVLDLQGRQIAAFLDDAVGEVLQNQPYEFIRRSLQGESVVTPPFKSSILLPDEQGYPRPNQPTMFVTAPVKDQAESVIAVLAFRLRPEKQFARALASGRPGDTGETYAFDQRGLLLSNSRFDEQLRQIGLIPPEPSSRAVLSIEVRDPGGNLSEGFHSSVPREALPLTRMAFAATAGKNGVDTTGYRDYRGLPVVGAWRWLPTYGFGVTHEVDVAEAYAPLHAIQQVFLGWLGLFTAALVASIALQVRRTRTERLRAQAQDALTVLTDRFHAVLDSATQVSIIATDMSGTITVFNAGAERMLQYQAAEMIDRRTPAVIHLESEVREHGEQLSREFGRPIQGFDVFVEYARRGNYEEREWTYVRKDGSRLTVTLVVTALRDSAGKMVGFLGIAKDITESKRVEAALRHERFLLDTLMQNLPESIYFKDAESRFLRISRALASRFGLSDPRSADGKTDFDYFTLEHAQRTRADELTLMSAATPIIDQEERETWPDGRRTWVATSKLPLRDETGKIVGTFGISRDITAKKLADERFRLVVEASLNAILMVDCRGKIVLLNSQTEKLFGYAREELLGHPIEMLVPPQIREDHPRLRTEFFAKPEVRSMGAGRDLYGARKDGSNVPIEIGLSPIEMEDGTFALASVVDITARKAIEDSLRKAKESAEAASRAKSDFLANMSHEIRTPMNAIIGMTELVLGTDLPAMQREYLSLVLESGEALLEIINEILDFSKIEADKLKLERIDFGIWDVVGDVMKSLALKAHGKGLELAYHIAHEIPERLIGDPVRLRQVIVNLVGNAIKFTERGEVLVDIACIEQRNDEVRLRFAVTDTGIGISPDKQQLIFEAFTQADSSTTRRFGGTGLGLAISSRVVALLGGELKLRSELGRGSTFWFDLWLTHRMAQDLTSISVSPGKLHGIDVLIVDDNATNRMILEEIVRSWGMHPLSVSSACEALDQLQRRSLAGSSIPLLLTDVHMPEMDGLMLVEQIRRNAGLADLRIIVLTSGDQRREADRWEKLGVAALLMKPVKQSELLSAIELALSIEKLTDRLTAKKPAENLTRIPPLRILLAEDGLANQKLAVGLLQRAGHQVTVANNGREAVREYENQSYDLVLMDVQMPELDGLEATARIRELEKASARRTPIVAMTARAMPGDREQCLQAGMDGYISKPIRQRDLYEAVASLFIKPSAASASSSLVDWSQLLEVVEQDRSAAGELIDIFRREAASLAAELEKEATGLRAEATARVAHQLKGTLKIFGVESLVSLVARIEDRSAASDWGGVAPALAELATQLSKLDDELNAFQRSAAGLRENEASPKPRQPD